MNLDPRTADNLRWFMDNLDEPPTKRVHVRGVWTTNDGLGSALGSPALFKAFARWIEDGEKQKRRERADLTCYHPGEQAGSCRFCGGTGTYPGVRETYCYPMRAAMARIRSWSVKTGRPDFAVTLATIARADGDLDAAMMTLARTYPVMGDEKTAVAHFKVALAKVRIMYRVDVPIYVSPIRGKSDAQLDAETGKITQSP